MIKSLKIMVCLFVLFSSLDLHAHFFTRHARSSPTRLRYPANRWWYSNPSGWPAYYSYYGYPIAGSTYYYSYPTNSQFFNSYPSYYRDYIYPSYPYNGHYYINSHRVPTSRLFPQRTQKSLSSDRYQTVNRRAGVFLTP